MPTAQNVTVDEVIGAYRQACQKLNCRQIPKLLRQLQVWGLWTLPGGGGGEREREKKKRGERREERVSESV